MNLVAKIFHCTVPELCAIAGEFNNNTIRNYKKEDHWPMHLTIQWNKLLRFKFGHSGPSLQEQAAAKYLNWEQYPGMNNEEDKAA